MPSPVDHRGRRRRRRSCPRTRRAGRTRAARPRSSSEYDQSTAARKRLVAFDRAAAAAGEEPESLVEQRDDLGRAHADDPRRGELDRERDAVEPATDLGDGARCCSASSANPGAPPRPDRRRGPPRHSWRRPPSTPMSPAATASAAAGSARPRPRAPRGSSRGCGRSGQRGRTASANRPLTFKTCSQLSSTSRSCFVRKCSSTLASSDFPGRGVTPRVAATTWTTSLSSLAARELAEPCAVGVLVDGVRGDLEREPGLAHASDAGDGHERCPTERIGDRRRRPGRAR